MCSSSECCIYNESYCGESGPISGGGCGESQSRLPARLTSSLHCVDPQLLLVSTWDNGVGCMYLGIQRQTPVLCSGARLGDSTFLSHIYSVTSHNMSFHNGMKQFHFIITRLCILYFIYQPHSKLKSLLNVALHANYVYVYLWVLKLLVITKNRRNISSAKFC